VAKVEAIGPAAFVTDLALLENRFQFARHLRERNSRERALRDRNTATVNANT